MVIMTSLMKTDERYKKWISDISKRFRQSQIKAAVKVNSEMLRFYWSMGRDIAFLSENAGYGLIFIKLSALTCGIYFQTSNPFRRQI